MKKTILYYLFTLFSIAAVALTSHFSRHIFTFLEHSSEHELLMIFFVIAALFWLSFLIFYISRTIKLPSFVIAIFFGMAAKPILSPIMETGEVTGVLVGLGATLILFAGGLETPFKNFRKLIWKILSLSFPGLLITALLFSWSTFLLAHFFGFSISIMVAVMLGAVLASTDPAAIIPILKKLRFHNRSIKDIIISESALTDVTGTLLTVVFLSLAVSGVMLTGINDWYLSIFDLASVKVLSKQLFFGILLGAVGYILLEFLAKFKEKYSQEFEADSAFFLFVPIIIFTVALAFGGSGYMAAFVAGLIFHLKEHLRETERFFNNLIDGFMKPMIFILLGSLVDLNSLVGYAPIGLAAAVIFMFVIRPISVFSSLWVFRYFGKEKLSIRDLIFISAVRETGAIPAVLMVTIANIDALNSTGLVEIGMWVILSTLIIEPLITPFLAKKLKVAEPINDNSDIAWNGVPKSILATRGESFIERLPKVVEWSKKRRINMIMVLLCLENKYSIDLSLQIEKKANAEFLKLNKALKQNNETEIDFKFLSRTGFLQDNIESIAGGDNLVTTIFVGHKMLDYRLNIIKKLSVPLYFLD